MDDDFLSDLNSAVDTASAGKIETPSNNVDPASEIAQSVINTLEAHEKTETPLVTKDVKDTTKSSNEDKTPDQTTTDKIVEDKTKQPAADATKTKTDDKKRPPVPYMDQFLKQDDKNNLVIADGTIIATAGKSRTFFEALKNEARSEREKAQQLALSNINLGEKFQELYHEFETLQKNPQRESLEKQTNMSGTELDDAISYLKDYKINPVKAIKRLLTQAQMNGIDLKEIGLNGGIDPAVVRETIVGILAKQSEAQEKPSQEKLQSSAEEEATSFLNDNPEAVEHVETLANAKRRFPNVSLNKLWTLLQIHMQKTVALEEEQASQKAQPKPQAPVEKNVTRVITKPQDYASMSYADIARSIMKERT